MILFSHSKMVFCDVTNAAGFPAAFHTIYPCSFACSAPFIVQTCLNCHYYITILILWQWIFCSDWHSRYNIIYFTTNSNANIYISGLILFFAPFPDTRFTTT